VAAGFMDFEITWRADVFSGAPQASSAANYGTLGINFRARKPRDEQEWQEWLDTADATGNASFCAVAPRQPNQSPQSGSSDG
jgi:hypothetical protein